MAKAIWKGAALAESDRCKIFEGNCYFPPDSLNMQYFHASQTHTTCPWKGLASYYDINVAGRVNLDAAWYYPKPKETARRIENYTAFWKGIQVVP